MTDLFRRLAVIAALLLVPVVLALGAQAIGSDTGIPEIPAEQATVEMLTEESDAPDGADTRVDERDREGGDDDESTTSTASPSPAPAPRQAPIPAPAPAPAPAPWVAPRPAQQVQPVQLVQPVVPQDDDWDDDWDDWDDDWDD